MNHNQLHAIFGKETIYNIAQAEPTSVEPEDAEKEESTPDKSTIPTAAPIQIQGANRKETILIVDDQSQDIIHPTNLAFLEKVLGAAKMNLDDIGICNARTAVSIDQLREEQQVANILLFGPGAFEIGIKNVQIPKYELKSVDGVGILACDNLTVIQGDQNKKKALWLCLQRMFKL